MSSLTKYRVHEVAKDFKLTSKDISTILETYKTAPKNHMQALSDDELNLIFDYITLHNQVDDIDGTFAALKEQREKAAAEEELRKKAAAEKAAAEREAAEKAAAEKRMSAQPAPPSAPPKAVDPKPAPPSAAKPPVSPAPPASSAPPVSAKPSAEATPPAAAKAPVPVSPGAVPPAARVQQKEKKSNENTRPTGTRQTHVVDTRGSTVDLSKYDDRVEKLVPEKAQNMGPRKEKIKSQNQRRSGPGGQSQKRRQEEQDRLRKLRIETLKKQVLKVSIPDEISVGELASRLKKTGTEVVRALVKMGTMASLSQIIDFDTASLVALEFGAKVEREVHVTIEERLIDDSVDKAEDLSPRSPVVVVMGHVDHGKTSLLDTIRKADVAAGEAGGITQHIGAYTVDLDGGQRLTFLDTPGHAAFTSMRERGANTTDIAILVVAADDGIMPQTIEAINHAKAAEIPIIVAVNKMDKPDANPDRVMQQLTEHALVPEDWGGETIVVKVSAKTGDGIPQLLEMVLLTAEMRELRANPNRRAMGTVIEAKLDRGRGPVATMLVQNGTLRQGDTLIAGKAVGRVRAMTDYLGNVLEEAGPSSPVEITGLSEVPEAGDQFHAVEDERMARELVEKRKFEEKAGASKTQSKVSLEDLFAQIKEGEIKDLNIIVKADVQGSVEALKTSLEKLSNEEVRVRVIHSGAGAVNESDVLLASTSNAIIVGFNVRPDGPTTESARRAGVDMRLYRVIYECIEEIEAAMKGLLAPKFKEEVLGHAEVRQIFKASNIGTIAGCYVQDGKIVRNAEVRVVRDGVVVYEGVLASLKRFKDDAKEVARGYECGISIENFNDIKEQDVIEAFHMVEIER